MSEQPSPSGPAPSAASVPQLFVASMAERVIAFSLDALLFYIPYAAASFFFPAEHPAQKALGAAALAAFLGYRAWGSAGWNWTVGRMTLGLRVVDLEGRPLPFGKAAIRSVCALVSAAPLGLGFLWSLFQPMGRTWHDLAAGSLVVRARERSAGESLLLTASAGVCLALVLGAVLWQGVVAYRYRRIMAVAKAYTAIYEIKRLQPLYRSRNGRFALDWKELSSVAKNPAAYEKALIEHVDLERGVVIDATERGFRIYARAKDRSRTPVALAGP